MSKISITIGLFVFVIGYIFWHINYRLPVRGNIVDNLAITDAQDEKVSFLWVRENNVMDKDGRITTESTEECFSLYELDTVFSAEKDVEQLQKLCDSTVEKKANGYKIAANCRNGSATFYVDVELTIHHAKWREWQQTILDISRNIYRQEKNIFKQRGECHVSN